jgi:hypothetical protein
MNPSPDRFFVQIAVASAAVVVCAVGFASAALSGPNRSGALAGTLAAAVSGALALVLVRRAIGGSVNALLKAIVAGFLTRMLLVAVGLFAVIRAWSAETALPFAVAFFGLFFLLQGLEFAYAQRALRTLGAPTS